MIASLPLTWQQFILAKSGMMDYLQPYTCGNFPFSKIIRDANATDVHEIWINSTKNLLVNLKMTYNLDNYGPDSRLCKKGDLRDGY